jgi:hypothetical protein
MAMAQIDHARNNGMVLGVGAANYESGNALALGVGKAWNGSGKVKEYTAQAAVFIANSSGSDSSTGVAGSVNIHF